MTPEQRARLIIDQQLSQCGWIVQDFREMNITAGLGVAVREFPLTSGHADYMLYADYRAIGVIEARPEGHTLTGVETQSTKYKEGLPANLPHYCLPLPFAYESTGSETKFANALERRRPTTFTMSRYLEHDRIPGVGVIARVKEGEDIRLSRLAKHLKVSERTLTRMKRLDVYSLAILRRDLPEALL